MNQLDCPFWTEAVEREEVANMEMEVLVLRLCFSYHHIEKLALFGDFRLGYKGQFSVVWPLGEILVVVGMSLRRG
jgi:hypothetical protein